MLARLAVTTAAVLIIVFLLLTVSWPGFGGVPPVRIEGQSAGATVLDLARASAATLASTRHREPSLLIPTRTDRRAAGADARPPAAHAVHRLHDRDALSTAPGAPVVLPPAAAARLEQRPHPRRLQTAAPSILSARTAPWTQDQLLADPTQMNDEYVSLAASPLSGNLFAVFSAYDLGGDTRDIYIARSQDQGQTWTVVKMPTFSLDESMPDLAIDAAGYLHVVWVRADGVLIRARSAGPENIHSWAYVQSFVVGEPVAVPSIAVSGSGDFARVFIACSWYTVNWNWYQYEYTLLWLYSTNGGQTVAYDYLEPDGHQDLWPVVAMHGSLVYMVNGELDPSSGRVRILAAADGLSGSFVDYIDLTQGTPMSSGYPSVAADGPNVHIAYQLDWDAGPGGIDGDVMYVVSWDGLATAYGPYAMMATTSESVGPQVYTRGGLVGCVWLEAPPGGDEFHLAARQAPFDGHPDYWGDVEQVTDLPMVVPQYRAADAALTGVEAGGPLVAVWMDRRDFPTQGFNIYTSRRPLLPNLAPLTPDGWQSPLIISMQAGQREDGPVAAGYPAYASLAVANLGLAAASGPVAVELRLDDVTVGAWTVPDGLPAGAFATAEDHPLTLSAGLHTLSLHLDPQDQIPESDETDNVLARELWVLSGDPQLELAPVSLHLTAAPDQAAPLALHRPWSGPVLDSRLQDALARSGAHERLRVVVAPRERPDPADLAGRSRPAIQSALQQHATHFAARLAALFTPALAPDLRSFWLSGELVGELTPAEIELIAAGEAVGRIWLDDQLSEVFSEAAAAGEGRADQGLTTLPWHLQMLGAETVWAQGLDGAGILVGHTDSGVAWDHPDLVGRLWDGSPAYPHHGYDFLDDDLDPYDEGTGSFWHGTHTAGLIVSAGHGIAPGARVLVTRCVPGYYQDLVAALQFCLDHGCHLISTSAGWTQPGDPLRSANRTNAEIMLALGVPWIAAAGNGDNQGGHLPAPHDISSPGDCPEPAYGAGGRSAVITVGAVAQNRQLWSSSSLGPTAWNVAGDAGHADYPYPPGLIKPDLVAPGMNVTSTIGGGGHATYSGTSMAAPLVAGTAAILLQASPALSPAELAAVLATTSEDLGPVGRDNQFGAGLVDLPAAVAAVPAGTAETVWVRNLGAVPLVIDSIATAASWLAPAPPTGAVAPGDSLRVVVAWDADGLPGGIHQANIVFHSNDPRGAVLLPVTLTVGQTVGVADPAPARTRSLGVYPNPFNPGTTVSFELPFAGQVDLQLFDARGRLVRTLLRAERPAGRHEVAWDGRDQAGRICATGVYLARLEGPGGVQTGRLLMVR